MHAAKRKILKNLEMENLLQLLNQHGLDNRSLKATENRASKIMYSEHLVNQKDIKSRQTV